MPTAYSAPEVFEAIVREHQRAVFATLHRLTGAGDHLQDLAQEVFLRLYRALPEFRGEAMLSTYLYRITVNVAQDEWKRRRRERQHLVPAPPTQEEEGAGDWLENLPPDGHGGEHTRTPEQRLALQQRNAAVEAALLQLPELERTAIVLYHQQEVSYEGIAATLEIPVNTVRTHLHRGRKRLAALVEQRLATSQQLGGYSVQGTRP